MITLFIQELLEGDNGIPVTNNNGRASLATVVDDTLGSYHFSKPLNAPPG